MNQWVRALALQALGHGVDSTTHVKQPSMEPTNSGTAEERQENLLCLLVTSLAPGSERPCFRGIRQEVTDRVLASINTWYTHPYTLYSMYTHAHKHTGDDVGVWLMKLTSANIQDLEDSFMGGMGET